MLSTSRILEAPVGLVRSASQPALKLARPHSTPRCPEGFRPSQAFNPPLRPYSQTS